MFSAIIKKIRKISFKKSVPLSIILIASLGFIFYKTNILKIGNIDIKINNASCLDEVKLKSELNLKETYFFAINRDLLLKKITSKYPCVKTLKINNKFPKDIKIAVEGRMPYIRVSSLHSLTPLFDNLESTPSSSTALIDWSIPNSSIDWFVSDKDGLVFNQEQQFTLPALFITDEETKLGKQLDKKLLSDVENIFSNLNRLNIQREDNPGRDALYGEVFKLKKWESNILIYSKPKLILSVKKDILRQLGSLQLILQKAKIDGKEIETVDLRFDKPVIVYSP